MLRQKIGLAHFVSPVLLALYLFCLPVYCLLRVFGWMGATQAMTFVIPCVLCACSLAHAIETRGRTQAALLFGSGAIIALITELIGTATGLLFGNYTYTQGMGYKLFGLVPWLIPVAWCGMLYPAWHLARYVLQHRPQPLIQIVFASLAMTAWDLSLDPRMVQDGNWIWHDGGMYFGIPLSNYVGWLITCAFIYSVWTILEIRTQRPEKIIARSSFASPQSLLPVFTYILVWLSESAANVLFWAGAWVGLCVFLGMGLFAAPAFVLYVKNSTKLSGVTVA